MEINFSAPLSGVKAAQIRHDVTSHDVANVNTKGFEERKAHQTDVQPTGTRVSHLSKTPNPVPSRSNTDLAEEAKEQIQNEKTHAANLKVIKIQDQMIGEVLDLKG